MKNKKYELLKDDAVTSFGRTLYRIKATTDFGDVKKGALGGYIQSEKNLSHEGDAWVYGDAWVHGDARVSGNARVSGDAEVFGDAEVYGNAEVAGNAWVSGNARVSDNARVSGDAWVYGDARVSGNAWVSGNAEVYGDALVKSQKDYIVFKNSWSSFRWFTYTKSNKMWKVGCFYGTGAELIAKAYKDSEVSGKHYESYVNLVLELEKIDG